MSRRTGVDWAAWYVEVYDEVGRAVLAKAFAEVRCERRAGAIRGGRITRL
jgi:hypothetical protein